MRTKKSKGFTLVELLIVVAIIGIIAAIAIPNLLDAMNRSRHKATSGDIRTLGTGIESYKIDNFGRSVNTGDTVQDVSNIVTGILANLGYLDNPPVVDGWGMPIKYCNRGGNPALYAMGSGGSNGPADNGMANADDLKAGDLTTVTANFGTRTSRRWECDICFADGQFFFGACEGDTGG
jgi:general secretion pathway protein G